MKTTIKCVVAMVAGLMAMRSPATEFTLSTAPTSLADWKNAAFYTGDSAPTGASTDIVKIPGGMTVTVLGTNSNVVAFLGSIGKLAPSSGSYLVIDVPSSASPLEYSGQMDSGGDLPAWLVKTGDGDLKLMNTATSAYRVNLHVQKGTVRLPPVAANTYNYYNRILVDEGATIYTMSTGYWQINGLHGAGLVTNDSATTTCNIYIMSPNSAITHDQTWLGEFSGAIGGKIAISLRNGRLQLTGTSNALSANTEITVVTSTTYGGDTEGTLELASLGMASDAWTSTGPGSLSVFQTAGAGTSARMVYLGRGETSDRKFRFVSPGENIIDGGLYGGLHLTGSFDKWSSTAVNPLVVLDGSNTLSACEFEMAVEPYTYNSLSHNYYIRKQGTGKWIFPANSRYTNTGVVEVRDGTLSFASLEEVGLASSLGYSTALYAAGKNTADANRVPYAFLLGNDADTTMKGMMEYTGSSTVLCTTRPFAIAGTGGLRTADDAGALKVCGFTSADNSGTNILVLAGDGSADNWAADITNGVGTVGVRKEGTGSWTLSGALDFSGPLEVCGGTLTVTNPAPAKYSHFRMLVKEAAFSNATLRANYGSGWWGSISYVRISEIGLYGADNKRYGIGIEEGADYVTLSPGESAFGCHQTPTLKAGSISFLFDNSRQSATGEWNGMAFYFGKVPTLSNPSTWIPIDMRLPDAAPAITHYDVCKSIAITDAGGGVVASAFALYGSVDGGLHWDLLGNETDSVDYSSLGSTYKWTQSGIAFNDGETVAHSAGWPVQSVPTPRTGQLANISGVKLSGGATLRFLGPNAPSLGDISVDASTGGGRIEGLGFAANGMLEVKNLSSWATVTDIPLHVSPNVDLSGWTLNIDGTVKARYKIMVGPDGGVRAVCPGFVISFK